eukprot:754983-Hanusia_phi.AAC.1
MHHVITLSSYKEKIADEAGELIKLAPVVAGDRMMLACTVPVTLVLVHALALGDLRQCVAVVGVAQAEGELFDLGELYGVAEEATLAPLHTQRRYPAFMLFMELLAEGGDGRSCTRGPTPRAGPC